MPAFSRRRKQRSTMRPQKTAETLHARPLPNPIHPTVLPAIPAGPRIKCNSPCQLLVAPVSTPTERAKSVKETPSPLLLKPHVQDSCEHLSHLVGRVDLAGDDDAAAAAAAAAAEGKWGGRAGK
mmetsp:Transcript_29694/g.69041  ORF Transcript_29694/g.69041 Transcript_29694/m.69041 type:complete len:124 (+) Transcript_29694:667-1038(+)